MKLLSDIKNYWYFYRNSRTIYDAHSPFLFEFITNVCDTSKEYYSYKDIELIRAKLLKINKEIDFQEYGAGSQQLSSNKRKIKDIAKYSSTSSDDGRLLHNCVINYHSKLIVELGTSLGIGTSYLAFGNKDSTIYTLEGDPASAYIAQRNFDLLGLENIKLIEGKFENTLGGLLKDINNIDLAFIDGHHTEIATINYFNVLIPAMNFNSIIILDDIYWSSEMKSAWNKIISHQDVFCSVDLFTKGVVFLKNNKMHEKIHFKYIKTKYKPWRIGLS